MAAALFSSAASRWITSRLAHRDAFVDRSMSMISSIRLSRPSLIACLCSPSGSRLWNKRRCDGREKIFLGFVVPARWMGSLHGAAVSRPRGSGSIGSLLPLGPWLKTTSSTLDDDKDEHFESAVMVARREDDGPPRTPKPLLPRVPPPHTRCPMKLFPICPGHAPSSDVPSIRGTAAPLSTVASRAWISSGLMVRMADSVDRSSRRVFPPICDDCPPSSSPRPGPVVVAVAMFIASMILWCFDLSSKQLVKGWGAGFFTKGMLPKPPRQFPWWCPTLSTQNERDTFQAWSGRSSLRLDLGYLSRCPFHMGIGYYD